MTKKEIKEKMRVSPVHTKQFWDNLKTGPNIEDKFLEAPKELVEYIKLDNMQWGFPSTTRNYKVSDDEREDVIKAIKKIPLSVAKEINKKLLGIFFVEDLGGSAYTDSIVDRETKIPLNKGFIVLDMKQLQRKANEWCTWKEQSPFPKGELQIKCKIADKKDDNRSNAILYILLHEMGHVLNINHPMIPFWHDEEKLANQKEFEKFPFSKLTWHVTKDKKFESNYDKYFTYRKDIRYYSNIPKVKNSQMLDFYKEIQKTNFPTGYAMNNLWDDFAESFVNYVHTMIYKRPFEISVWRGNKKLLTYTHCWKQKRCRHKRRLIEQLFK